MGLEDQVATTDDKFLNQEHDRDNNQGDRTESGPRTYTFKKGVTQVRILPQKKREDGDCRPWYKAMKEHYLSVNGRNRRTNCPSTWLEECPVCEEGKSLFQSQDEDNIEKSKDFRPSNKFLANAIVLSDPDGTTSAKDGVQLIKFGVKVKKQLLSFDRDFSSGWGNLSDLKDGFDVRVTRSGDTMQTTDYSVVPIPKRTNVIDFLKGEGVDVNSLNVFDLDEVLDRPSKDQLVSMMNDDFVPGFPSGAPQEAPPETETPSESNVTVESDNVPEPYTNGG